MRRDLMLLPHSRQVSHITNKTCSHGGILTFPTVWTPLYSSCYLMKYILCMSRDASRVSLLGEMLVNGRCHLGFL
jgi:hypothetical protein